ncbi:MAG: hypothetical protein HY852_09720 [Bradyrhizobium sp.]|uniref:hypothetical protein n=1 Tax=Bradyrhizobium sp. TaxID=376 RepID=UPI0025BB7704|nr:hypothetical protein [Bradyrhizobium sp.]MBI5262077.1 hypothetical protein [Bradyrhizobium sp.]
MAERRPTKDFGKRRPASSPPPQPQKRSGHVALLVMGTLAVGATGYALMPKQRCEPPAPGMAQPQDNTACTSSRSGSGGRWSHYSFFSSNSSSHSPSATSTSTSSDSSSHVTRGGFGSFGHAFGFSGGG